MICGWFPTLAWWWSLWAIALLACAWGTTRCPWTRATPCYGSIQAPRRGSTSLLALCLPKLLINQAWTIWLHRLARAGGSSRSHFLRWLYQLCAGLLRSFSWACWSWCQLRRWSLASNGCRSQTLWKLICGQCPGSVGHRSPPNRTSSECRTESSHRASLSITVGAMPDPLPLLRY